jgi:signal transduction histidine kinase
MDPLLAPSWRRVALDWLAPSAILAIGIVNITDPHSGYPGSPVRNLTFLAVAVAALGLRRQSPLLAPCVTIAVVTWWTSLWPTGAQGPFEGFVVLVGGAYSLGTIKDRRKQAVGAGVLIVWFLLGLMVGLVGGRVGDVVPLGVWLTLAFGVGYLISRRTDQAAEAVEAARMLAADQEQQTARAIEDERARIARELHDVVAHGLSVIVVQAGAERRSLSSQAGRPGEPGFPDTASIDAALGSIEKAGRDALIDLRRLLGLLRRTDEPLALAPQPGLAQLDDLLATARDAGLDVELDVTGDQAALPPGLDLTAYRIIQEALTNVLKHGHADCVRVAVTFRRGRLDLEISDDGVAEAPGRDEPRNAVSASGTGHGLIGMRERVNVFGGTLTAGAAPTGGWTVHARLPLTAAEE